MAQFARPATVLGGLAALAIGYPVGGEDLALALLLVFVSPFLFLRALLVLSSERIRAELDRRGVFWLGQQYLSPTIGGVHALIFGLWVTFFGVYGLVRLA
jgi:hypothetical protein